MRIVEHRPSTASFPYRALWVIGVISSLSSVVVCAFLIANNFRLKAADPVHTPALQRLLQELKASPQNETLKQQVRDLDYLARRAFFTSQQFNQVGIWLLLGSVAVSWVAFKSIATYHRTTPYPDSHEAREDLAAKALWARQSVTVVGLILVGLALSLALPWQSPLDQPPTQLAKMISGSNPPAPTAEPNSASTAAPVKLTDHRAERSQHWPGFRGPAAGHASATLLPTNWNGTSGTGIVWKTAIPLPGFGSPILWGDRVFVSGANAQDRAVYGLDAVSGRIVWTTPIPTPVPPNARPKVTADTGHAAPTMVADGQRVFALFATGDLTALEFDGKPAWTQSLGVPDNPYGHGSSLVIFNDLVIVQFDHRKEGFVAAFDARTGVPRWKIPRKLGPSWATPALIETTAGPELILVANAFVTALDPGTGQERWRLQCLATADVAPSPLFAQGRIFVAAEHVKFVAIDAATHQVVWENKDETPAVGTPVAAGDALFAGLSDGGIQCWDLRTGQARWQQETDNGFYASPIAANGRIYLPDRTGKMFIFNATPAGYQPVGQPELGEEIVTTPAIYGESLILRGTKHLFRIGS